jgi:electron transport complex protein RnfG
MIERMVKLGVTLMVVGTVAAVGLGLTYTVTRKKIEQYDKQVEAQACLSALPGVKSAGELKEDKQLSAKVRKKYPDIQKVFTCDKGYIFVVKTRGYGGPLTLAVGIDPGGKVRGAAAVTSKETVGLGSKALEAAYLGGFKGKTAAEKLKVGEDVQAVTGATITSKAVTGQVKQALEAFSLIKQ